MGYLGDIIGISCNDFFQYLGTKTKHPSRRLPYVNQIEKMVRNWIKELSRSM